MLRAYTCAAHMSVTVPNKVKVLISASLCWKPCVSVRNAKTEAPAAAFDHMNMATLPDRIREKTPAARREMRGCRRSARPPPSIFSPASSSDSRSGVSSPSAAPSGLGSRRAKSHRQSAANSERTANPNIRMVRVIPANVQTRLVPSQAGRPHSEPTRNPVSSRSDGASEPPDSLSSSIVLMAAFTGPWAAKRVRPEMKGPKAFRDEFANMTLRSLNISLAWLSAEVRKVRFFRVMPTPRSRTFAPRAASPRSLAIQVPLPDTQGIAPKFVLSRNICKLVSKATSSTSTSRRTVLFPRRPDTCCACISPRSLMRSTDRAPLTTSSLYAWKGPTDFTRLKPSNVPCRNSISVPVPQGPSGRTKREGMNSSSCSTPPPPTIDARPSSMKEAKLSGPKYPSTPSMTPKPTECFQSTRAPGGIGLGGRDRAPEGQNSCTAVACDAFSP